MNKPTGEEMKTVIDSYLDACKSLADSGDYDVDMIVYCGILMMLGGLLDNVPQALRQPTLDAINRIIGYA